MLGRLKRTKICGHSLFFHYWEQSFKIKPDAIQADKNYMGYVSYCQVVKTVENTGSVGKQSKI